MVFYGNNTYKGAYFSAMDRGYAPIPDALDVVPEMGGLSPGDIGISAPPMQNQLEALQAKIRQGAMRVELGFMGRGKGSMGQGSTTPEMYGLEERRDMKELAKFNKVILTTHSTPAIGNVSGLTEQGFNEMAREQAFNEIRRAIDFAADVTQGGAVVLHTGEFQRPLYDNYPDFAMNPAETDVGHRMHPESERKKAVFHVVDERTGQVIPIRTDQPVPLPVWKKDGKGNYVMDEYGERVPETETDPANPATVRYKMAPREWSYFVEESSRWNREHSDQAPRNAELQYFIEQNDMQRLQFKSLSKFYGGIEEVEETKKSLEKVKKALTFYEELEKNTPPEDLWKLKQQSGTHPEMRGLIPPDDPRLPTQILKDLKTNYESLLQRRIYSELSYTQQARDIEERQKYIKPIKEYAIQKSADTIARAGLFAMQKSEQMKTPEPIFVAPENIFPETYGSHPQELRSLIVAARKSMAQELEKRHGYDSQHAAELAQQHIKATFDIGHGYTWRKYFIGDPDKSIAENDTSFKRWLLDEVEKLARDKIIGHIHVSDNFGYEDEHVDPGMGRAPIKEFVERMKAHGIKNVIVEPAHQDFRAMLGGWRHFGSSIYGVARPGGDTWSDVWRSYFGQTAPPYFIYGESAPDPESWVLWSGTRME
ncbi:sugar phosphate isomerase/epimerase [Candidatus Woesearchaeota archaeon]|nr:sugar phosphate isomerase/epimerase [Candidatus Woesearchaeota archaeon]